MLHKQRRIPRLIKIPFTALVWCIGWSLLCVGEAKSRLKIKLPSRKEKLASAVLLLKPKMKLGKSSYKIATPEKIG
jgi:hypothetical protein